MAYNLYHLNGRDVYANNMTEAYYYALAFNSDGYYISKYHFEADMDVIAEQCNRAYNAGDMERFNQFRNIMEYYRNKAAVQGYLYTK